MAIKRYSPTRVNEETKPFSFRIENSLYKKLLKAAKKKNLYLTQFLKIAITHEIERAS